MPGPSVEITVTSRMTCRARIYNDEAWREVERRVKALEVNTSATQRTVSDLFGKRDLSPLNGFPTEHLSPKRSIRDEFQKFLVSKGYNRLEQLPAGVIAPALAAALSNPGAPAFGAKAFTIVIRDGQTQIPWEAVFTDDNGGHVPGIVILRDLGTPRPRVNSWHPPVSARGLLGRFSQLMTEMDSLILVVLGDPPGPDFPYELGTLWIDPSVDRRAFRIFPNDNLPVLMREHAPAGVVVLLAPSTREGCLVLHQNLECHWKRDSPRYSGCGNPTVLGIFPVTEGTMPAAKVAANWASFATCLGARIGVTTYEVHQGCDSALLARSIVFAVFGDDGQPLVSPVDIEQRLRAYAKDSCPSAGQHLVVSACNPMAPLVLAPDLDAETVVRILWDNLSILEDVKHGLVHFCGLSATAHVSQDDLRIAVANLRARRTDWVAQVSNWARGGGLLAVVDDLDRAITG